MVRGEVLFECYIIAAIALMRIEQGQVKSALELYNLVKRFPNVANSYWFEDYFGKPIQAASANLPAGVVAAAQQRGQELDLSKTVGDLLAHFNKQILKM